MIDFETLSPDAAAIILLCTSVGEARGGAGSPAGQRPLGPVAYARLADILRRQSFRGPRDLLDLSADEISRTLGVEAEAAAGYVRRFARSGQLAFELDRLRSRGVWVVTIADEAYPSRLRDRLASGAPPVLFGAGSADLLAGGGIAIVGSRDADEAATTFTEALAAAAARGGTPIVSGGARGVDSVAMRAAFEAGGAVIGVVPEGVERRLREATTRSAVAGGQAVLTSPYHPAAGFSAGAAMGRNKLIYALSDVAVVVSSTEGSGGTWAGATDALKGGWVPVLVRDDEGSPPGNAALIRQGATPVRSTDLADPLVVADLAGVVPAETPAPFEQRGLFDP